MSFDPRPTEREMLWLIDIVDNADLASQFTADLSVEAFRTDDMVRAATERAIERASEAAHRLGERGEMLIPGENWGKMRGMGNVLRHEYDRVIDAIVYEAATVDLPRLKARIIALLGDDYAPFDPDAFDPNSIPARRIEDPS